MTEEQRKAKAERIVDLGLDFLEAFLRGRASIILTRREAYPSPGVAAPYTEISIRHDPEPEDAV